uniref:Uncharacterized protein n=1 Tax=Mycena chlorophos TaxID=658473 RepID=A0ABQ0MBR6_MYCCL|nr:predicted protein [Mycena chlorophos]
MSLELDSLSDSEWLDVGQDDTDSSLSDTEDHISDTLSLPPSRRSSLSVPSDAGDIDAWEGFVEPEAQVPVGLAAEATQKEEEDAVNAGLEQSMTGTLSASRSSSLGLSTTTQNSIRDLRLSFPDPLTSSRDELNRSYEAVTASEAADSVPSPSVAVPPSAPVLPIPDPGPVAWTDGASPKDVNVFLYGDTGDKCREFAQWLVQTVLPAGGHSVTAPSSQPLDRPSLAIVSLPCNIPIDEHSLYLPVVLDGADMSKVPENIATLNIPPARTLCIDQSEQYFVDTPEARDRVIAALIPRALLPALTKRSSKVLDNFRPAHAVTFVALLSIIMGFAVNTAFRAPAITPTAATPAHTAPSTFWGVFGATPNSSVAPMSPTAVTTAAAMPSTLKELALAVFNPATTTITTAERSTLSSAPSLAVGNPPKVPRDVRAKSNTDVIVRPQSSLSLTGPVAPKSQPEPIVVVPARQRTALEGSSSVTSLDLKLGGALAEVADATMRALMEVLPWDLRELMLAFDELLQAIGRQTVMLIEDTQSQARVLRERLLQRNERAKQRARDLRNAGERLASAASDRIRGRAKVAKARAQELGEKLMSTSAHVWRSYAQAHEEWAEKLERKKGRTHQGGLFAKLKQRRERRKQKRAL